MTPWTVARQAPLSTAFPRQEYWNGLPFPPRGDLPNPGIDPRSPVSSALADGFLITEPGKPKIKNSADMFLILIMNLSYINHTKSDGLQFPKICFSSRRANP